MKPKDFLRTIYLGDRSCKSILIDGWGSRVMVLVDLISRVRDSSGLWNYYSQEDILNGLIVFQDVDSITLDPPGFVPNGYINGIEVEDVQLEAGEASSKYLFQLWVDSTDSCGLVTEVEIKITARSIHLADSDQPDIEIID